VELQTCQLYTRYSVVRVNIVVMVLAIVELAGLPAPPTSHTLHLYPSILPLPFPFSNNTAGNLEIHPDLL